VHRWCIVLPKRHCGQRRIGSSAQSPGDGGRRVLNRLRRPLHMKNSGRSSRTAPKCCFTAADDAQQIASQCRDNANVRWQPCKLLILRGTHSHNSRRNCRESEVNGRFESVAPRGRKDHLSCNTLFPNAYDCGDCRRRTGGDPVTAQLLSFRVLPALRRPLSYVERQLEVIETT
jgi:hypothetical protein